MKQFKKLSEWLMVVVFLLIIFVPIFQWLYHEDKAQSLTENRVLKQFPKAPQNKDEFNKWPDEFTDYYSEQFGFRDQFNHLYARISERFFAQDVTLGQDNWYFLGSSRPNYSRFEDPIGDYVNRNNFTKQELDEFVKAMNRVKTDLSQKNIPFFYLITPNKHTIYSEKLPTSIKKDTLKPNVYDQLNQAAQDLLGEHYLNVKPLLMEAKKNHQIYFQFDTHWNNYGANVVQFELLKRISKFFPEQISPKLYLDSEFIIETRNEGDLLTISQSEPQTEENPKVRFDESSCRYEEITENKTPTSPIHTKCANKKLKLLMYRDSFSVALIPFLAREFGEAHFYWEKLSRQSLDSLVELYQPDVVIEQMVERKLPHKYNY